MGIMLCYSFRLILYVYGVLENDGQLIMSGSMMNNPCLGCVEINTNYVDHNETSQAVANIDEAEILEIIDHHRIGSLETIGPVYFRNQPLGCTGTIIYQMYMEKGVEVTPQMAGLMCAAILSDTLVSSA